MEDTNDARQLWLQEPYTGLMLKASQGAQKTVHNELLDAARSSSDPKVTRLAARYDALTEQVSMFSVGRAK